MNEPTPTLSVPPPCERQTWIDTAKGVGIVAVVVGHGAGLAKSWTGLRELIYLFHMPLFFMISGMLLRPSDPRRSFARKLGEYLPPYIAYLVLFGLAFQTHAVIQELGRDAPTTTIATRVAADLLLGGVRLKGAMTVFWYLPVLFLALQVTNLVVHRRPGDADRLRLFLIAYAVAVAGGLVLPTLVDGFDPLDIVVVPMVVVFLLAGRLLAPLLLGNDRRHRALVAAIAALVALADVAVWAALPERANFDLKIGRLGIPVIGISGAIALSVLVLLSARPLDRTGPLARSLRRLGEGSLTIMFVHPPVIYLAAMLRGQRPELVNPLWVIPASLIMSLLAHRLFSSLPILSRIFLGRATIAPVDAREASTSIRSS